jgi:hypothetical protein
VIVLPLIAAMVRRSACLGSKSVDARNDLVVDAPARRVEDLDGGAAGVGGVGQLAPGVLPITVQAQRAAHDHDPAVTLVVATHATEVFVFDVVGEGDGRLARVGVGLAANLELAVQHDPLGRQLEVLVVGEAEFAVDRQTAQRRRSDVEENVLAGGNRDLVACGRNLAVWPRRRIRPARLLDRRRFSFLGLNDSEDAGEQGKQ